MKHLVPKTAVTVITAAAAMLAVPALASAAPLHVAAKHSSTVSVSASPRVADAGTSVKLSATVKSANPTPGGTVTFWHGKTKLCSAKLADKSGHCSTKFDTAGSYAVSGVYSGDAKHSGSTGKVTVVAEKAATTTTLKVSTAAPSTGKPVTFTATVSSKSPLAVAGTVKFTSSNGTLGSAAVSKGVAHYTYAGWKSAGSYKVTATYLGNTAHAASHATSGTITVKTPSYATTTTISSITSGAYPAYPADVPVGSSGVVTVTVASPAGDPVPTGYVTVTVSKDAGAPGFTCTKVALVDGTATCTVTPPTGTFGLWPLVATYTGDDATSTSAIVNLVVPDTTSTSVSFDATTDTITATVVNQAKNNIPGTSSGIGTVTFSVGGVDVCTEGLTYNAATGNTAMCSYTPTGSVTVTAAFSGNEFNLPSTGTGTASAGGGGGDD